MIDKSQPVFGPTNREANEDGIQRYGSVIGLKAEYEQQYRELHANVWPAVLQRIEQSNIRNYSIYTTEIQGEKYLVSYFEYVGSNFETDMALMAADPIVKKWWIETDKCQNKMPNSQDNEQWSVMEKLFFKV